MNPSPEPLETPEGTSRSTRQAQLQQSLEMARATVRVAAENRGQELLLLDLTAQTSIFDFFIIVTGSSRRQLAAISTEIDRMMKTVYNERKMSISGYEASRWIVLDYGNIVVHLFDEETRRFYDLESLWGDAKMVDISDIVSATSTEMTRLSDHSSS